MNILLDKVNSSHIFFLDSDDYLHPQTFACLKNALDKTGADIAECSMFRDFYTFDPKHFLPFDASSVSTQVIDDMNIFLSSKTRYGAWINKVNKLYRWDNIKSLRFSEQLAHEDDYFYATQVNTVISKKVLVSKQLYFYRSNPKSMCHSLNFKLYQESAIARIELSYDYFLKENRVPMAYLNDFKDDLVSDAYRMIIRKSLKKCPDKKLRHYLFQEAANAIHLFVQKKIIEPERLSVLKRLTVYCFQKKNYILARMLIFITP